MRQSGAWGTDLRHRYTSDLFFRTTIHIVALQSLFVLALIGAFWVSLRYSNAEVTDAVVLQIAHILDNNGNASSEGFSNSINTIQTNATLLMFIGIAGLAVAFGVIIAHVTLRPARSSLENQKLFISNVAHELRTPLSTIKTSTEVLLLHPHLAKDTRETLTEIVEELDRASEIINNLLSLNRLLRPERIEFKEINFKEVVASSVERLRALARGRGVEITLTGEEGTVWGNASALEQVITNIVRNSISYMARDRKGAVHVSVEPYAGYVTFTVSDNGIGIAQKDLFHIFEPFYRADTSRGRATLVRNRGTGLGLAIVNEIVRIHHGSIRIQSTPGKGTTTTVTLPTSPERPPMAEVPASTDSNVNEVSMDFSQERTNTPYFNQAPYKNS